MSCAPGSAQVVARLQSVAPSVGAISGRILLAAFAGRRLADRSQADDHMLRGSVPSYPDLPRGHLADGHPPVMTKGRPGNVPAAQMRGQKISGMKVWSDIGGRT